MKILTKYILISFIKPFISTFLIALFILILQLVWLIFDDIAGKGITFEILLKYIFYITVVAVPRAIPIAILLSSIMALGQLSENYEFAAIKSAGVSLQRLMLPLFILVVIFSFVNLFFLNNAYPWAVMKQKNMTNNIRKKQPALALVPGTFNKDAGNYVIKFDEKYGKDNNLLKNVLIYQTKDNWNVSVITAEKGKIATEEGSKYLNLVLENGYYYEEHSHRGSPMETRVRAPFSTTYFDKYTVNIDISALANDKIETDKYKNDREMLNFSQLTVYSDSLKQVWDEYLDNKAKSIAYGVRFEDLKKTVKLDSIKYPILSNFNQKEQTDILNIAYNNLNSKLIDFTNFVPDYKYRRKGLNQIDTEYHHRIAMAFSALLLFLIGIPLGALIRKGGFGLPMIFAIIIYMLYHFTTTFSANMAEESSINNFWGGWLSTFIFLPFAVYLIYAVATDKGKINFDPIFQLFNRWLSRFKKE